MELVSKIICLILWCTYSYFEGMREAYYYQLIIESSLKRKNIHWMYFLQRGITLLIILCLFQSIFLTASLIFIFPFVHDGSYYITYNKLNPNVYKEGFKSSSTTSTAFIEFNWSERIVLLLFGIFFYIVDIIYQFQ